MEEKVMEMTMKQSILATIILMVACLWALQSLPMAFYGYVERPEKPTHIVKFGKEFITLSFQGKVKVRCLNKRWNSDQEVSLPYLSLKGKRAKFDETGGSPLLSVHDFTSYKDFAEKLCN